MKQNDDYMSCVTGITGKTGTKFYIKHTRFDLLEEFGNAVDKSQSESKLKRTVEALGNLQDYMDAISHQLSKW